MTSTWDGLDLRPAHGRWRFWVAEGRDDLPDVRISSEVIPFRRGRLHQPGFADQKRLELRGYIQETDDPGLRTQLDLLKRLLAPERDEPGLLTDDFEDGTTRWIRAVPRNVIPRYGGTATRLLSIELEALDPFWYSAYGTLSLDAGVEMDDDELMDAGGEIVVVPPTTQVMFTNPGTTTSERIRVRFVGASSGNVGIENLATPELVGFTTTETLAGGDRITVNNYARTARRDLGAGLGNVRGSMTLHAGNVHGEYLRLIPGSNTLRVIGSPAECRITYFPTWL